MLELISGYRRFRSDVFPERRHHFNSLANNQCPGALFITCADSRIDPTLITQAEPGDLFICRVVGNLVPAYGLALGGVSAAVEYAVSVLGVKDIVVCGHSDCGAMRAFLHPEKLASLKAVTAWLEHANAAIAVARESHADLEGDAFVEALAKENVLSQLQHLRTHPCVAAALRKRRVTLHGWYYDIAAGSVSRFDDHRHDFVDLAAAEPRQAVPA